MNKDLASVFNLHSVKEPLIFEKEQVSFLFQIFSQVSKLLTLRFNTFVFDLQIILRTSVHEFSVIVIFALVSFHSSRMLFLVPLREILEGLRWPVEAENHLFLAPRWFDNSSRNSFRYFLSFGDWRPRILLFYHLDVRVRAFSLPLHHFLVYFLVGLTWMLIYVWGLIDVNHLFCILISVSIVFIIGLLEILVALF